jgi:hypothetical protein
MDQKRKKEAMSWVIHSVKKPLKRLVHMALLTSRNHSGCNAVHPNDPLTWPKSVRMSAMLPWGFIRRKKEAWACS